MDTPHTATKHHKTIVISDTHLGSKWSKAKEVTMFLKQNSCDTLILCGDIIDGWNIMRNNGRFWNVNHSAFIKLLFEIQYHTKIVYLRGNHDDFLEHLMPLCFENVVIANEFVYSSNGRRYYVLHGDILDAITRKWRWIAKLGDIGYSLLLWANHIYHYRKIKQGLPVESIAQKVKHIIKRATSQMSRYPQRIVQLAQQHECEGVICGHIHRAEIGLYQEVLYLNSGDWVESLSALAEDHEGNWTILKHSENRQSMHDKQAFIVQHTINPELNLITR